MEAKDGVDIESVGRNQQFLSWISSMTLEPSYVLISGNVWVFAVDVLAGPVCDPVGSALEKLCRAEGVREHDAQCAVVSLLPELQHLILRSLQLFIVRGEGSHDHGDFVGIGADGFKVMLVRKERV